MTICRDEYHPSEEPKRCVRCGRLSDDDECPVCAAANAILLPMRPGMNLGNSLAITFVIPGWGWQPKVNDERAVLRVMDGALFNRRQQPADRQKAEPFRAIIEELRRSFSAHPWLDLGLIGYRDAATFAESRGAVVVFDVPDLHDRRPWIERRRLLERLPTLDLTTEKPRAGIAYRLEESEAAGVLFARTIGVQGLEGIVGRHMHAPYQQGDARTMAKVRWLKG